MTCAGLKKCRPMKRSGRLVDAAWSITDSDDVLVASTAPSLTMPSSSRHISSFLPRSSVIASITRSQSAKSRVVGRALDPAAHRVGVGLLHLALLDRAAELLLDLADALLERRVVDLAEHDVVARLRAHLRDAVAHEPGAEHSHLVDVH